MILVDLSAVPGSSMGPLGPTGAMSLTAELRDPALDGLSVFLQVIEPAPALGVSNGLRLVFTDQGGDAQYR